MKKPLALGAVAAMLAFGITSAQQPVRIGIAFDAGGKNDRSFNQSAFEGAQRAAKAFGVEVKDFEPSDPSQVGQGIRNFAESGFDLVIGVGFANEPSITKTAAEFKDIKFAVIDSVPTGDNTVGAVFREHEGSFLVGYIAGKTSSTGVVGFVGGMDIPLIRKFYAGYRAGVKAACPTCTAIEAYTGTTPEAWNNPAKASRPRRGHHICRRWRFVRWRFAIHSGYQVRQWREATSQHQTQANARRFESRCEAGRLQSQVQGCERPPNAVHWRGCQPELLG